MATNSPIVILNDNIKAYWKRETLLESQLTGFEIEETDNIIEFSTGQDPKGNSEYNLEEKNVFCRIESTNDTKLNLSKISFVLHYVLEEEQWGSYSYTKTLLTENVDYRLVLAEDGTYIDVILISTGIFNRNQNSGFNAFVNYDSIYSNVVSSNEVNKFEQNSTVIYQIPISKPFVQTNSRITYIEDSLNADKNEKYSYISSIKTEYGYNLFGVKRLEWFANISGEVQLDLDTDKKANINANVVKLTPKTTQIQIYSFKNGNQYVELNKEALNKGISNDGKLIPHYLKSYEYKIDGSIPTDGSYNIKFYGSNGYVANGNISTSLCTIEDMFSYIHSNVNYEDEHTAVNSFLAYSFIVPYTYTLNTGISFYKIKNSVLTKNEENINNASQNSKIYENTYIGIDEFYTNVNRETLKQYSKILEVYERHESYTKLDSNLYTSYNILSNISNFIDAYEGVNRFYKYDNKTLSYIPITSLDDTNKLEVYSKSISYLKISSAIKTSVHTTTDEDYNDINVKKYIQLYDYIPVTDKENANKSLYYIKKEITSGNNVYFPIQSGIVNDGSIEYYSYTYFKLPVEKIVEYKSSTNAPELFIKQSYTFISPQKLQSLSTEDLNNLYICDGDSVIYKEPISNNEYIFDLDITGKTIYAKSENNKFVPINKSELENIYFNDSSNWFIKNKQEEIAKNTLYNYSLPSMFNICAKIHYEGKWSKIDIKKLSNINDELNEYASDGVLYLKKESYNKINSSDLVDGYDVDFYVYGIGKINSLEINNVDDVYVDASQYTNEGDHPFYMINDTQIVVDENIYLKHIDNYGFINDLEYYTRKPKLDISHDLYFFIDKEYYSEMDSHTVEKSGVTPLLPISFLGIKQQSGNNIYSLSKYWQYDSNPLYSCYVKLRQDTAKILYENEYEELYYNNDSNEEKTKVTNFDNFTNTSSYYVCINAYENNNFSQIVNILQSTYDLCIDLAYYNSNYDFKWNQMSFYKDSISHYMLSDSKNLVTSIVDYDKKYLYSKYFYEEFTVNNGIHQAKDGSYYTNVSIFDGTRGTISKPLFLQPNIFNVVEYTYEYTSSAYIDIDFDENLKNIPQSNYSNYYVEIGGELKHLKAEDQSPAYYQSYIKSLGDSDNHLYIYKEKTLTAIYDGRNVGPNNELQVQYFDNVTYEPKIIQKNDTLFGIIFNIDLYNNDIIKPENNLFEGPIESNFNLPYEYDIVSLKEYIEEDEQTFDEINVLQSQTTNYKDISVPTPFYLANEKQAEFTGSYIWNLPKHSYVFSKTSSGNYEVHDILKDNGYWEREYNIHSIPFVVASYNFYSDPSKISNTTLSYTFTPDSKVITSVIEHPEICYKYVVKESHEVTRFTYILGGKEYDYPSDGYIQENEDGTYIGLIKLDEDNQTIINLIKYIDVDYVNTLKDIKHQEHSFTYEYSSYKTSLALTNEKVPVLYNTELIPATSHKVLYWNEDASSYAIRTVIDSYAYYAYHYLYDVVPFVTNSYMIQASEFTISYINDISNALQTLSNNISEGVSQVSQSVSNMPQTLNDLKDALINSNNENNVTLTSYIQSLSNNLSQALNNLQTTTVQTETGETAQINVGGITNSIDNQTDNISSYISNLDSTIYNIEQTINSTLSSFKDEIVSSISNMFEYDSQSIAKILKNGLKDKTQPTYEEFMIDLTSKMYAKIDFDEDIVETEQKDENGNIVNKSKHKPNANELAKKTIYRADILWQELKKKNIIK